MSHSILKQGTIDLQSFTGSQSKYACLCAPRTTQDLTTIYLELFKTTPKNMNFLGHLASSSINHTPLLILMSPKPSADNGNYRLLQLL